MSHFTVLVIGDDIEGQMAPFDENIAMPRYRQYTTKETPAEEWDFDTLVNEAGLAANAGWDEYVAAHNAHWRKKNREAGHNDADSDSLFYDAEQDKAYEWSTYNPESKWDYWRIGGRWGGYFPLKAEYLNLDARTQLAAAGEIAASEKGWDSPELPIGYVDRGRKKYLDLNRMRVQRMQKAAENYDFWHEAVDGTPEALPWSQYYDRAQAGEYTMEEARTFYQDQPRIKVLNSEAVRERFGFFGDGPEELQVPRDVYIARARAGAVPGYAVLHEGKWTSPGDMGWWGLSSDDASSRAGYWEHVNGLIDSLDDDVFLTVLDCHI